MKLYLTIIDEKYDVDRDYVIGPWCFLGNEEKPPHWETLPYVDAYSDVQQLSSDSEYVRQLANVYVRKYSEDIEREQSVKHSYGYWRILLLPWILWSLQITLKRYRHVQSFIRSHGDKNLEVLICPDRFSFNCDSLSEVHYSLLGEEDFNYWLTSKIVRELAPENWKLVTDNDFIQKTRKSESSQFKQAISLKARLKDVLHNQRCRGVYGIGLESILLSFVLNLMPRKKLHYPALERVQVSDNNLLETLEGFSEVFHVVADMIKPSVLARNYHEYDKKASNKRFRKGKINLVGPVLMMNEADKFYLANAVEKGEFIVSTQHGGSGYKKVNSNSVEIEYRQHAYISWGWSSQERYAGNIIPLPSPFYSKLSGRKKLNPSGILFVGNQSRIYSHRLESNYQPTDAINYRKNKIRFLSALSRDCVDSLMYRPLLFEDSGSLSDESYVKKYFPLLEIFRGKLHERIMESELLVLDHPGTTLSIGFVAGVPTIGFWDRSVWVPSSEAQPLFDELLRVGILHDTPASAAQHVNKCYRNLDDWWQSSEVQTAKKNFCNHYAHVDKYWLFSWIKQLWKL